MSGNAEDVTISHGYCSWNGNKFEISHFNLPKLDEEDDEEDIDGLEDISSAVRDDQVRLVISGMTLSMQMDQMEKDRGGVMLSASQEGEIGRNNIALYVQKSRLPELELILANGGVFSSVLEADGIKVEITLSVEYNSAIRVTLRQQGVMRDGRVDDFNVNVMVESKAFAELVRVNQEISNMK